MLHSKNPWRVWAAGLLITMTGSAASAMPINFSEAVSGDLAGSPADVFLFDVGSNTISGTTHFGVNTSPTMHFDSDFDSFAFTVPDGFQLASISLSFTTTSFNAKKAEEELLFCTGALGDCDFNPGDLLGSQTVSFFDPSPVAVSFGLASPLAAGTYSVIPHGLSIAALDPTNFVESWSADYTWTYEVERIPEPATLWLFAFGMTGVLAIAKGRAVRVASLSRRLAIATR